MEVKVPVWTGLRGPGPLKYPLKQGLSETGSKHCIQARPHFTLPHLDPFWALFGVNLGPISRPKTRALPSKMHILEINSPILEHNLRDPGGRLFRDTDPGVPEVVVWPDALWRDYYCVHAR